MGLFLLLVVSVCFWAQSAYCQSCPRDGVGFYAHPRQCDAYFECVNGTATEVKCPDGLVFNEKRSIQSARCDYPTEVDCSDRPVLQQARSTSRCPRRWGMFAHQTDCSKFWNCVDGTPYGFQCPEGLAFNDESNHCDWPDQVERCSSENMLEFQCPDPEYASRYGIQVYAHQTDCRKHYVCVYGTDNERHPRLLACQEGLVFNTETSTCDRPRNVPGCENYYGGPDEDTLGDPNAL